MVFCDFLYDLCGMENRDKCWSRFSISYLTVLLQVMENHDLCVLENRDKILTDNVRTYIQVYLLSI